MTEQEQIAAFVGRARQLIGARWRHRGRKPWAIDCVGLLVLSAKATGWPLTDQSHYGREPWEGRLRAAMIENLGEPVGKPYQAGDVVLIRWGLREPSHVGILADYVYGGLSLIHCDNLNGCLEQRLDERLMDCIVEVFRPCAKFCQ